MMQGKSAQQPAYEKFREPSWAERMSNLPKQSAYKSSIMFADDGLTTKIEEKPQ